MTHYPRTPARTAAYLGMCRTGGRMHPCYDASGRPAQALRRTDPVAHADLVTSMNDYRAALLLAVGVDVEDIDRDGYDLRKPEAREYLAAQREEYR